MESLHHDHDTTYADSQCWGTKQEVQTMMVADITSLASVEQKEDLVSVGLCALSQSPHIHDTLAELTRVHSERPLSTDSQEGLSPIQCALQSCKPASAATVWRSVEPCSSHWPA